MGERMIKLTIDGHVIDIDFVEQQPRGHINYEPRVNVSNTVEFPGPKADTRELLDAFCKLPPFELNRDDIIALSLAFDLKLTLGEKYNEVVPGILYTYKSDSDTGKFYVISYNPNLKRLMCSCPSGYYRYPAVCKHVTGLENRLAKK